MIKYSFLLLISFISLALISLPKNIFSDFKNKKINRIFIYKSLKLISSFVFLLTLLQILSFKFFLISNILKPFIYIFYTRSLLRSTIIVLTYFLTSSFLSIFINNNFEINLLLSQQSNTDFYIIFCLIYIILNLLCFSNSFASKLLFLNEKYPQSLSLKVFLSILLSARFNFINKKYLVISIFTGFVSSTLITYSAYNLSSSLFFYNLIGILILFFLVYFFNNLFLRDKNIKDNIKLIDLINNTLKEFLDSTNQRVFIANYCYKKDKSLAMLSDIIKLKKKKYIIMGGGYSKNIVLLHPDKKYIYKIFGTDDDNAENYYEYHISESFRQTFFEYNNKVFLYKQKKTNFIKVPFFKGKTVFEQFYYHGSSNKLNKYKIDIMLQAIFTKMKKLHSAENFNKNHNENNKLTDEDLRNYIDLKFLKNAEELLKNRVFKDNNKTIFDLKNSLNYLSKEWGQSNQKIAFTHGDLSFSNIIISFSKNKNVNVNFIDPNPSNLYLFPSPIIDISKLLQSTYIMWELATKTNDYLEYGIKNTNGIFMITQPYYFNYAEKKIRKFARDLGFSDKTQDLHLLIHLKRILPYISKSNTLKQYLIGFIYFILFEKYRI